MKPTKSLDLAKPIGAFRCARFACWGTPIKKMKVGERHQTANGFFTITIEGWYCPKCGAGYGGNL